MPAPLPVDPTLEEMREKFKAWWELRSNSYPHELEELIPRLMARIIREERIACAALALRLAPGSPATEWAKGYDCACREIAGHIRRRPET
jgi:hypothetical protein